MLHRSFIAVLTIFWMSSFFERSALTVIHLVPSLAISSDSCFADSSLLLYLSTNPTAAACYERYLSRKLVRFIQGPSPVLSHSSDATYQ